MMNWKEKWEKVNQARKILKLPFSTTRREIIERYHALARELHPDQGGDAESMKALNEAYQVLMEYCDHYKIEFKPDPLSHDPEDFWFQHFAQDPVWGRFDQEKEEERE